MRWVICTLLLLAVAGCGAQVGREYRVASIATAWTDKAAFEEGMKHADHLVRIKDADLFVSNGIRVRVIETCPAGVRIEVMEGDNQGKCGWTTTDALSSL